MESNFLFSEIGSHSQFPLKKKDLKEPKQSDLVQNLISRYSNPKPSSFYTEEHLA